MRYFFFFNDTATTEIYTLSLHDALPICGDQPGDVGPGFLGDGALQRRERPEQHVPGAAVEEDRKSTRLNSSHANISYAVFCLKKKKKRRHALYQSRSASDCDCLGTRPVI